MSFFTASLSEGRSWLGQVNSDIILYLELKGTIYKCELDTKVPEKAKFQPVLE